MTDITEIIAKGVQRAIDAKQDLEFSYTDKKGNVTKRHIQPTEVKDGKLFGFDRDKNDATRCFLLENMTKIKPVTRIREENVPF
jgi:predicted DNA-binding transcriptional regulator YafY